MTGDLPPMDPCPFTRDKGHRISFVLPGDDQGDITLTCSRCAATRRVPASGPLVLPLDDRSADEITAAADAAFFSRSRTYEGDTT